MSHTRIILEIVNDIESNMILIKKEENIDILRHRILNSANLYLNNFHNNNSNQLTRMLSQKIVQTKRFLKCINQLLVTHA